MKNNELSKFESDSFFDEFDDNSLPRALFKTSIS